MYRSLPVRGAWVEISAVCPSVRSCLSLPVRGAWVEIILLFLPGAVRASLPVRGAWVEMSSSACACPGSIGRSPCGERGLKSTAYVDERKHMFRRSPCGERGLKCRTCR